MSEEKKNEAEQKELNLDEMDQVAGGNIITDILKKVVPG